MKVKMMFKYLWIIGLTCIYWQAAAQIDLNGESKQEAYVKEILAVNRILNDAEVLDSLVERVYAQSGLLKAFDEEILMYEEERLQKKRNWVSSFRFGVNLFSAQTTLDGEAQSVTTLGVLPNVGLTMAVDPEKLVNRRSYIRQAENKQDRSRYLQSDQKQMLKKELLNAYYDYLTLLESLVIKAKTLESRQQHVYAMEIEFRNGNAQIQELLVVQNQVYLMEEDLMKARITAGKKKSEIEILLGTR